MQKKKLDVKLVLCKRGKVKSGIEAYGVRHVSSTKVRIVVETFKVLGNLKAVEHWGDEHLVMQSSLGRDESLEP